MITQWYHLTSLIVLLVGWMVALGILWERYRGDRRRIDSCERRLERLEEEDGARRLIAVENTLAEVRRELTVIKEEGPRPVVRELERINKEIHGLREDLRNLERSGIRFFHPPTREANPEQP